MEIQERTVDGTKPALMVTSLVGALRRCGSDRLMNLPQINDVTDDLYCVCDVLQQKPTSEQLDDFALRLSNFLEETHRYHIDSRWSDTDVLGVLSVPMSLPIIHRAQLMEAQLRGTSMFHGVTERETICMLYLNVPRWTGCTRTEQLAKLDEVARRYRLRCVDQGVIPQPSA
jgi:hypothetical protein